jgi:fumarate reductase flavoprotein subunit
VTDIRRPFTRRQFISSAAVGAVGLQAASPLSAYAADQYDVIIIGAGTAGIPCAIHAAEAGAKVLLIDKSVQIGGSLWLAGGSMAAAGTRLQARKGIKDSPDLHYEDIMHLGHNKAVPEIVRRYVDNAAPMADWLEDLGFQARDGEPVAGRGGHAAFSVARYFQGPEKGRSILKVLMPALKKQVDAGKVRILMSTGVDELIVGRDRSVQGVIAVSDSGVKSRFLARKVVITSGGYCNSAEVFKKVTGYECYALNAYYMAKGEGLLLGEQAGGYIRGGQNQILGPGGVVNDRNSPSVFVWQPELEHRRRPQWEIRVNQLGQRFVREDDPDQDERDILFTKQPTQRMWLVFDQQIEDQAPAILRGKNKAEIDALFGSHPMFFREPTIEALAASAKLNAQNLKRTVQEYNAGVRNKHDSLGREFLPCEIAKAPFYAIEITGGNLVGFGGLAVNPDMQVLRPDGSPVQNLYAAGEVIGLSTIAGDTVVSGTGVTPSLTFGRLIGKSIMRQS